MSKPAFFACAAAGPKDCLLYTSYLERFEFYDRARKAYCIVATGERAQYANIILKKGVVR